MCVCAYMMIIAFITLNSILVPLIEGLYSSNLYGFEFSVLAFIFQKKFFVKGKKQLV